MLVDDRFLTALSARLADEGLILLGAGEIREDSEAYNRFRRWLAEGRHGAMGYLENHLPIRKDPRRLLDHANLAIIVGMPYFHSSNRISLVDGGSCATPIPPAGGVSSSGEGESFYGGSCATPIPPAGGGQVASSAGKSSSSEGGEFHGGATPTPPADGGSARSTAGQARGQAGEGDSAQVARYSVLKDYHKQIPKKAKAALAKAAADVGQDMAEWQYRVVTDSAPLLERAVAARHSRGFIGKNTMFIHPSKGSFILLGEIIAKGTLTATPTGAAVDPSQRSEAGGCGSCKRCQTYCPTDALNEDYTLDARHCLSYWSIEHRGAVPYRYWRHFATYLFGCDICQVTCPYNRQVQKAPAATADKPRPLPSASELVTMNQSDYERWFGGIPMTRAKITGLRRNGILALSAASSRSAKSRHRLAVGLRHLAAEQPADTLRESGMAAAFFAG